MSPARVVIERFGGVPTVADLLGIHRSQVYRWDLSKEVGGQEGVIPAKFLRPLLLSARRMNVALSAEELILGSDGKPVEAPAPRTATAKPARRASQPAGAKAKAQPKRLKPSGSDKRRTARRSRSSAPPPN